MGRITPIPRREHSVLTVARKPSRLLAGDGQVKLSLQYLEAPAKVLFATSATTTCTPFIPRDRVAASALLVAPSNIRTLSSLGRESGPFDVVSDEKIGVPIPPSRVSVSSVRGWLFI